VGHDVGQQRGYHKATQQNHAGLFSHHHKHFIGQALGKTHLGEGEAHQQGPEYEQHRGVHEVPHGFLGGSDHEKGLQYPNGYTGDSDGYYLKNPPHACQEK